MDNPEVRNTELHRLAFRVPVAKPSRERVGRGQSSASPGAELVAKPPRAQALAALGPRKPVHALHPGRSNMQGILCGHSLQE